MSLGKSFDTNIVTGSTLVSFGSNICWLKQKQSIFLTYAPNSLGKYEGTA